jgi:two-component system response regulator MtrA
MAACRPDVLVVTGDPADVDAMTATCRRARGAGDVPIVMVPDVHRPAFCLAVLAAGADDCVAATDPVELILARVHGALVRRGRLAPPAVHVGNLVVDEGAHVVLRDGEPVQLSPLEFGLLAELAHHPGVVVGKADMLHRFWTCSAAPNNVDQAVSRLRRKLGRSCRLRTVRGVGYVLVPGGGTKFPVVPAGRND